MMAVFVLNGERDKAFMSRQIPKHLGYKLKAIREYLGYTQDQMAEAVGKTGSSRRTRVHEWETGKRQPDLPSLLKYAQLVNLSTDELINDTLTISLPKKDVT